jgi:hypothetical protein
MGWKYASEDSSNANECLHLPADFKVRAFRNNPSFCVKLYDADRGGNHIASLNPGQVFRVDALAGPYARREEARHVRSGLRLAGRIEGAGDWVNLAVNYNHCGKLQRKPIWYALPVTE